jgi:hypothetical protein
MMASDKQDEVPSVCGDCGAPVAKKGTCPKCSSTKKRYLKTIEISAKTNVGINLKHRRPRIKHALVEMFVGRDLRKMVGDFVNKVRRIDRASDRYVERVWTDDGTVMKDVDYRLSEKRGSGSDKPELRSAREAERNTKVKPDRATRA